MTRQVRSVPYPSTMVPALEVRHNIPPSLRLPVKALEGPAVFPLVYLLNGQVVRAAPGGYAPLRSEGDEIPDVFDITDRLFSAYRHIYLVDVNGKEGGDPQLDYLQEISRGQDIWVEAAPTNADQVIDIVVAGASRVVVATKDLADLRTEIRRALALTEEIALEVALNGDRVESRDPRYDRVTAQDFIGEVASWGLDTFILTSAATGWETVASLAQSVQVYVNNLRPEEMESLRASGAAGAIMEVSLE